MFTRFDEHRLPGVTSNTENIEAPDLLELLDGNDSWNHERIEKILNDGGEAALLEQLAFDSDVDIEVARHSVRRLISECDPSSNAANDSIGDELDPEQVLLAVNKLNTGHDQGASAKELFDDLANRLGLENLEAGDDLDLPREEFGPDQASGLAGWTESYIWEAQQAGQNVSQEHQVLIEHFCSWTQKRFNNKFDAVEIQSDWVIAWLCSFSEPEALQSAVGGITEFLHWCENQQDAPLNKLSSRLQDQLFQRLVDVCRLNQELHVANQLGTSACEISAVKPLRVLAESGDQAEVVGVPSISEKLLRKGDHLFGRWEAGQFRACTVLVAEALPAKAN